MTSPRSESMQGMIETSFRKVSLPNQECHCHSIPQGGVTPIDSIVTAATAVGQWSTVKAAQTGAVNGQSGSKVQSKTRAALFMVTCRQVLQGQIADRSKVNGRKSAWSTVKTPKTAVKALTRGRSCDYRSDPPLQLIPSHTMYRIIKQSGPKFLDLFFPVRSCESIRAGEDSKG